MSRAFLLLITTLLLAWAKPSWALGKMGHQIVCQLSYDLLSTTEQAKLDNLLTALTQTQIDNINHYTWQKKGSAITFANSCTWADLIKNEAQYLPLKSWHYINIERDTLTITDQTCQKDCVTQAIPYHQEILSTHPDKIERLKALLFLGHWLGDIHQPLHVSFASDFGGNKNKIISPVGRCNNLHWYWDECLLYPLDMPTGDKTTFDYDKFKTELISQLYKKILASPRHLWQQSQVSTWANESLNLIREDSFHYCHQQAQQCLSNSPQEIKISEEYHQHYQTVLHQRIMQAAVRLSHLLSQSL